MAKYRCSNCSFEHEFFLPANFEVKNLTCPYCGIKTMYSLPEKPAPRIATNRELAKWLAQGKGEWCNCIGDNQRAAIEWWYDQGYSEKAAKNVFVRKWDDTEWHEPDVEYMGITEVKTYEDVVKREG